MAYRQWHIANAIRRLGVRNGYQPIVEIHLLLRSRGTSKPRSDALSVEIANFQ